MTTTEKLARFETAQETLGMLVAMRTSRIFDEKAKSNPNTAKIAQWEKEIDEYNDEDLSLSYEDSVNIDRIIRDYGPLVKANIVP